MAIAPRLFTPGAALTIAALAGFALAGAEVHARSTISAAAGPGAQQASAALAINVQVPKILYLQVGTAGATINTVRFDVQLRAPLNTLPDDNIVYSGNLSPRTRASARADDDGASNANLAVRIWTNNGSVTLDCAGAPLTAGNLQIPLSAIQVSSSDATLAHPGATLGCTALSVGSSGTNNLRANWRYRFTPASLPAYGNYTTTITYTASQP